LSYSAIQGFSGAGVGALRPPRAAVCKGQQNKYFKWKKKIDFLGSTNFKLMSQMKGNSNK
jgi:hypothetical protein